MVDDLVTRGVSEPYRMFTSRAEFRLSLRADNADQRLTELGIQLGCVGSERTFEHRRRTRALVEARSLLNSVCLTSSEAAISGLDVRQDGLRRSAFELLSFPDVDLDRLSRIWPELERIGTETRTAIEAEAKYAVYLDRQQAEAERLKASDAVLIDRLDFGRIRGLSNEVRNRLDAIRPATLGHAARIEGMTPAALTLLLAHAARGFESDPEHGAVG